MVTETEDRIRAGDNITSLHPSIALLLAALPPTMEEQRY